MKIAFRGKTRHRLLPAILQIGLLFVACGLGPPQRASALDAATPPIKTTVQPATKTTVQPATKTTVRESSVLSQAGKQLANWRWPVAGAKSPATPFLAPPTPYGRGHRGIDIRMSDERIHAPDDGVVSFSGQVAGRGVITIAYPNGMKSSIEPVESELVAGARVTRGQLIATLTGSHAGCGECIHFGVRLNGEYVNPMLCFGPIEWSVLVPN